MITKKYSPVNQPWCTHMMIKDILTHHGDWKEVSDYNTTQKPAFFELSAIKQAIGDYIEEYKYRCGSNYMECIRGIKPKIGVFNILEYQGAMRPSF